MLFLEIATDLQACSTRIEAEIDDRRAGGFPVYADRLMATIG
jgi:hypothetical protein